MPLFRFAPSTFRLLLQLRLEVPLTATADLTACTCWSYRHHNYPLQDVLEGHHFATRCDDTQKSTRHNVVRNEMGACYKELRKHVVLEPARLPGIIAADDSSRPADILVDPSTHHTDKHLALDVSVVSPDNVAPLDANSHTQQYKAASQAEQGKRNDYKNLLARLRPPLTPDAADYEKVPIVMESTGAWGPEMQKWWAKMLTLHNEVAADQANLSRRARGQEHTWSANSFSTWWAQRISCAYMRNLGESIQRLSAKGPYSHFNA